MNQTPSIENVVSRIVESQPPVVVLGVGIPGSGKTTLFRRLAHELTVPFIEVDELRHKALYSDSSGLVVELLAKFVDTEVARQIMQGGVALVDSTNCDHEMRATDIARYRGMGAKTIGALWFDSTLDTAFAHDRSRRKSVGPDIISYMQRALSISLPSIEEGFDWVQRISD